MLGTGVQTGGGFMVLGGGALGAYLTWQQLKVNRERQVTDRFTRAVDQLGSDRVDVRVGGIYALERIARTSKADHGPVFQVLTSYLKEHAPWPPMRVGHSWSRRLRERLGGRWAEKVQILSNRAADLQAILTVIGRRNVENESGLVTPWRQDNLASEPDLSWLDLRGADLQKANLEGLFLIHTRLKGARLTEANLFHAFMPEVDLTGAVLFKAKLEATFLAGARLEGALLMKANMQGALLGGPRLGDFSYKREPESDRSVHLEGADLSGADLWSANLAGAHLDGAILCGAKFGRTDLTGTSLVGADLTGTDLRGALGLTESQVESALRDDATRLPKYLSSRKETGGRP